MPFATVLSNNTLFNPSGKRCTRLSKSDIRVQIVHSDHNATRGNDDEEDVKEPMVNTSIHCLSLSARCLRSQSVKCHVDTVVHRREVVELLFKRGLVLVIVNNCVVRPSGAE